MSRGFKSARFPTAVDVIDFLCLDINRALNTISGVHGLWIARFRAKREAGALKGKAGAAPATVSGEPLSIELVTGARRRREGQTEVTTREPGDLP
jgi:hypothetical protein